MILLADSESPDQTVSVPQADLGLCGPHMPEDTFLHCAAPTKYREPTLERQHLFPKMLPLK